MSQDERVAEPMSHTIDGDSSSTSNNQAPHTPPRGRASSRYPVSLAKGDPGRVPLHRRGTSKTYERLEDLLREAGYKETRVFTPEMERAEAQAEERRKQRAIWRAREASLREGVGAVVDFFAGWIPGTSRAEDAPAVDTSIEEPNSGVSPANPPQWSLPPSPLPCQSSLYNSQKPRKPQQPSPSASTSTLSSMRSANSSNCRVVSYIHPMRQQHLYDELPHPLRPQSSASGSLRTYAQVSAARGYLRHMASAPNIPKRVPYHRESIADRFSILAHKPEHPLPASWLSSVTKAVAGSSRPGAHVGGPIPRPSSRQSMRANKASKFALADHTNKPHRLSGRSTSGLPPALTSCMRRSQTAPGAVNTAQVLCRSTPASRSSSQAGERTTYLSIRGKDRVGKERRNSKLTPNTRVPSLASTMIENDGWGTQWKGGRRVQLSGRDEDSLDSDDGYVDDDEDDGELDLARLLVPPKRQYSIQSLRRHLHHSHSVVNVRAGAREDVDGEMGFRGRSRRCSIDEGDGYPQGWETLAGGTSGFDRLGTRRRRGIPGTWGGLSGGRS